MGRAWETGLEAGGGKGANGAVLLFFGGLDGVGYEAGKDGRGSLDARVDEEGGAGCRVDRGMVGRASRSEADLCGAVEEAFQVADGIAGLAEVVDQG